MKIREITFVSLRLIAIWIFLILAVPNIYSLAFYLPAEYYPNKTEIIVFFAAQSSSYLIFSIILWFFADKISVMIFSGDSEINPGVKKEMFVEISLSVIGIYLIAANLPSFISNMYSFWANKTNPAGNESSITKYLIQSTAGIVVGIVLVVGKIDVGKLVKNLKSAGIEKEP